MRALPDAADGGLVLARSLLTLRVKGELIRSLMKVLDSDLGDVLRQLSEARATEIEARMLRFDQEIGAAERLAQARQDLARHLSRQGAALVMNEARATASSATVVFLHALIDDVALQCCEAIVKLDPEAAMTWFQTRQIAVADALQIQLPGKRAEILSRLFREIQASSLPAKVDRIMQVCGEAALPPGSTPFNFNAKLVMLIDEERHRIVHDVRIFPFDASEHEFLLDLGEHLLRRVAARFGLDLAAETKRLPKEV